MIIVTWTGNEGTEQKSFDEATSYTTDKGELDIIKSTGDETEKVIATYAPGKWDHVIVEDADTEKSPTDPEDQQGTSREQSGPYPDTLP